MIVVYASFVRLFCQKLHEKRFNNDENTTEKLHFAGFVAANLIINGRMPLISQMLTSREVGHVVSLDCVAQSLCKQTCECTHYQHCIEITKTTERNSLNLLRNLPAAIWKYRIRPLVTRLAVMNPAKWSFSVVFSPLLNRFSWSFWQNNLTNKA